MSSLVLRNLVSFLVVGAGGIGPLAYIVDKSIKSTESKLELTDKKIWDCQIKQFDKQDLKLAIPNSPFFKIIHCFNEKVNYDWQMFFPKSILESVKLDEFKSFNLVTASKTDNLKAMKITQGGISLFKDWLLMRKINSHNIEGRQGEDNRYSQSFEFQMINYLKRGEKSWVLE